MTKKITITVSSIKSKIDPKIPREVEATVVGHIGLNDGDGILAIYEERGSIIFCAGDDGQWWEIWRCHKSWMPEVLDAVKANVDHRYGGRNRRTK